ncbi:flavodoxin family protein [Paucibacter sp. R3-3]|uniref:Flavodoxin family protein n=1 Tax=Roseateles agri TaxID=3098619 RepID=A0ABU5DM33_9BURK|nr:flavodoxin family protein [Paucibacter sp. R3-3]MDY0746324.1 flavodoxin family protein [Paucibacter sp. R3-3]
MTEARKGQAPAKLSRAEFGERYRAAFRDPAFQAEANAIARLEEIAWSAYQEGRKSPTTRRAGAGFADPDYELSVDWLAARDAIARAQSTQADPASPSRVLMIIGSARNDGSCPGEISKSFRLAGWMKDELEQRGIEIDTLDLSLTTSEYGRAIHPCKGCVSTAMPLCHWPCSCYPNHSLGQATDWMNEIYPRWVAAHAIIIVSPVYWYQAPSPLKLMIDRLVCADGGNPDPTSTHGKKAEEAKALELAGWDYPQHLAGRVYGLMVHGDVAGIESARRNLSDWLEWMGLIDAGQPALLDRYIGYYEPYATSHEELDRGVAVQQEARNVALAVAHAVEALRRGTLTAVQPRLRRPRPK